MAAATATATKRAEVSRAVTALVARVVAGYLLTPAEVKTLAADIHTARLAALVAAYQQQASNVSAVVADDWQPPATTAHAQERASTEAAAQIAATYRADLSAAAVAYAQDWLDAQDDDTAEEDEEDDQDQDQDERDAALAAALALFLHGWCADRAAWKSRQVADYETRVAAAVGVGLFVDALTDGDLSDAAGNPLDPSEMAVMVLPDEAKEPFCQEYAGNAYPLDAYDDLDVFPAHFGCDHFLVVFILTDGDVETEW